MKEKTSTEYLPGQFVPGGVYWHRRSLDLVHIPEEGGTLPAGDGFTYRRVPVLLLMGVGPIIGLAFILFLPVAVPVVLLYSGIKAVRRRMEQRVAAATEREARLAH